MDVYYLQGTLKFERTPDFTINNALLKTIIVQALLDLHGEYGASTVVEVIEYKELTKKSYSFVIKIPASNLVKVWSSLTLLGRYNGVTTMFTIHQVTCDQELVSHGEGA